MQQTKIQKLAGWYRKVMDNVTADVTAQNLDAALSGADDTI